MIETNEPETNEPETAHERYLRCLREAEGAMDGADERSSWDGPEVSYWNRRARTWAVLAQGAATMCLAEAIAAKGPKRPDYAHLVPEVYGRP